MLARLREHIGKKKEGGVLTGLGGRESKKRGAGEGWTYSGEHREKLRRSQRLIGRK